MDDLQELVYRLVEAERRIRNMMRYAEVAEVDLDTAMVKVVDKGGGEGKDLPSDWLPWAELGAPRQAGEATTWRPPTRGQRVMWFSPSGDLAEGIVLPASFSNAAPQPSKASEHVETIGRVRITYTEDSATIQVGGARIVVTDGRIELEAQTIVTKGNTHLGAEGGILVHRKGDIDSDGDAAVGSAVKVYAT